MSSIASPWRARQVAEFDYEWPSDKLFANAGTSEPPVVRFELSPSRLFVTSPGQCRWPGPALRVDLREGQQAQLGTVPMERGSFMISQYEPTFVIHHPQGRLVLKYRSTTPNCLRSTR